jgi:3-hydroxyisobutyrate dehydrogenase-like beta-hydroxyacid dehydrogenase
MDKNTRIAFLGLGAMGTPMARRVLDAGYPLTVWNRSPHRAAALVAKGAEAAETPADAVRDADVVITMLADPAAVREVVAALAPALRPGQTLIESSTIGPDALREVAVLLPDGVTLVDSPVMGSVDKAEAGGLSLLVGGDADPVMPLLELFGTVTRTGGTGTGAALKIVLISAVVAGVTMIGEAMTLADAFGLPEDLVKSSMAASPVAGIAARAFSQDTLYQVHLAAKDVALATASADLPLYRTVHDLLTAYPSAADEDLSHIVKLLRTNGPSSSA